LSVQFSDRYTAADGFFNQGLKRYEAGMQHIWETNFISDIQSAKVDKREVKGAGVSITQFEIAGNSLIGHLAQWPAGALSQSALPRRWSNSARPAILRLCSALVQGVRHPSI
jgi:hypothetical protein